MALLLLLYWGLMGPSIHIALTFLLSIICFQLGWIFVWFNNYKTGDPWGGFSHWFNHSKVKHFVWNCVCWWIGTGLGVVHFGGMLASTLMWYSSLRKVPIVVSSIRSGYCSLRPSSDLMTLSLWGTSLVWFGFWYILIFAFSIYWSQSFN